MGMIGSLFSGPPKPPPPPPPPAPPPAPPTMASASVQQAGAESRRVAAGAGAGGFDGTLLTGGTGAAVSQPGTEKKLLGES